MQAVEILERSLFDRANGVVGQDSGIPKYVEEWRTKGLRAAERHNRPCEAQR